MPQEALQIWLVRTKAREILGPFSQAELFEQLRRHVFSFDDEIALSEGQWISAQTLAGWDTEEVTHTSTRNQTLTRSFSSPGNTPTRRDSFTEELTPTPEDVKALTVVSPSKPSDLAPTTPPSEQTVQPPRPLRASPVKIQKGAGRVLSAIIVAFIIGLFVVKMGKPVRDAPNVPSYQSMGSGLPIVKETYTLIQSGENREALRKLTQYHEKRPKDDLEYMVPYAALLILEKESVGRARKLLDQVLGTSTVPAVKAKAYLWLGYLLLSQEEGDMGENAFLESLQLNPRDAAARFNLGRTYLKQEKYAQALDYLQLAELEIPDLWLIHLYKARARVALGQLEEARISFNKAIQSAPDRWLCYVYYALFLSATQQTTLAQNTIKKMMTRDPHYETHSPQPFGFFQENINYTEYLSAYSEIMKKASPIERELGKAYISYLLSNSGANEGRRVEALAENGNLTGRILALKVMLDRQASAEELKRALGNLSDNLTEFGYFAYVLRGEAKSRINLWSEAQQDFQKALELEPKAAVAHWAYANMLAKTQHRTEAVGELRSLLTYHPNYIPGIVSSRNY